MIPIIPVAIDWWMMRDVAASATIISTTAPQRSDRGAREKNAHHTTTANPPRSAPSGAMYPAIGPDTTMGTT